MATTSLTQPVRYSIVPKNPAAHLFEVTLSVAEPDPAGLAAEHEAFAAELADFGAEVVFAEEPLPGALGLPRRRPVRARVVQWGEDRLDLRALGLELRRQATAEVGAIARSTKDHRSIFEAIQSADPDAAAQAMKRHLDNIEKSTKRMMTAAAELGTHSTIDLTARMPRS